jgi:beta-galactosidase
VRLETDILDADGKSVAHFSSTQSVAAGATVTIDQTSPARFPIRVCGARIIRFFTRAVTTVSDGSTPVDDYQTTFGMRWIKWTADQGFFINDEHVYFHGRGRASGPRRLGQRRHRSRRLSRRETHQGRGAEFHPRLPLSASPGLCRCLRQTGRPLLVGKLFLGLRRHAEGRHMDASAYPANADEDAAFEQSVENTLRDEIRIFRNHPSIIDWSMCNEVYFSGNLDKVKGLLSASWWR